MDRLPKPTFSSAIQREVRDTMRHNPVFSADQAIPEDIAEKLARLDRAFESMAKPTQEK